MAIFNSYVAVYQRVKWGLQPSRKTLGHGNLCCKNAEMAHPMELLWSPPDLIAMSRSITQSPAPSPIKGYPGGFQWDSHGISLDFIYFMGFNWGLVGFDGDSIKYSDGISLISWVFFMRHTLRCPQKNMSGNLRAMGILWEKHWKTLIFNGGTFRQTMELIARAGFPTGFILWFGFGLLGRSFWANGFMIGPSETNDQICQASSRINHHHLNL